MQRRRRRNEAEDLVAHRNIGAALANGLDDAREVPSDDGRELVGDDLHEVAVGVVHVEAVHASGPGSDEQAASGSLRVGQLHQGGGLIGGGQRVGLHSFLKKGSLRTQR